MSGRIRTVLGDVPADDLSGFDAHEHLFLDLGAHASRASMLLASGDEALDELNEFRRVGGGAVVCATPIGLGRKPLVAQDISRRSGVAIVLTGGLHKTAYYSPSHWVHFLALGEIADLVAAEVEQGIDVYDYNAPVVSRTGVRPGILKAGAEKHRFRGRERELHALVAEIAAAAGLPMLLHVEHGADPHPQLDVVEKAGLPLDRVLVSHLDRNPDVELHRSVLGRGAFIVHDGLYRENYRPESVIADLVADADQQGMSSQVLLGGDLAIRDYRLAAGTPGIAGVASRLTESVRRRCGDEVAQAVFTSNARKALLLRT